MSVVSGATTNGKNLDDMEKHLTPPHRYSLAGLLYKIPQHILTYGLFRLIS